MQEYLNPKEKSLLDYIYTRYTNTMEVKFRIPINDYSDIGVKNSDELRRLLMALCIRNYIFFDFNTASNYIYVQEITLTEKALNFFNAKQYKKTREKVWIAKAIGDFALKIIWINAICFTTKRITKLGYPFLRRRKRKSFVRLCLNPCGYCVFMLLYL